MKIIKTIYKYRALSSLDKRIRAEAILVCESLESMASNEKFALMAHVLRSISEKDVKLVVDQLILACSESMILQMAIRDMCKEILQSHNTEIVYTGERMDIN